MTSPPRPMSLDTYCCGIMTSRRGARGATPDGTPGTVEPPEPSLGTRSESQSGTDPPAAPASAGAAGAEAAGAAGCGGGTATGSGRCTSSLDLLARFGLLLFRGGLSSLSLPLSRSLSLSRSLDFPRFLSFSFSFSFLPLSFSFSFSLRRPRLRLRLPFASASGARPASRCPPRQAGKRVRKVSSDSSKRLRPSCFWVWVCSTAVMNGHPI
mmetsp:Transcript_29077/g.52990  ORF Transcript_29077/g.52990 Transcript_29077/m.52990 type:complete len:211 (-) Transcript_29077:79-711(-)